MRAFMTETMALPKYKDKLKFVDITVDEAKAYITGKEKRGIIIDSDMTVLLTGTGGKYSVSAWPPIGAREFNNNGVIAEDLDIDLAFRFISTLDNE